MISPLNCFAILILRAFCQLPLGQGSLQVESGSLIALIHGAPFDQSLNRSDAHINSFVPPAGWVKWMIPYATAADLRVIC
jgi:hypothetical protein